MSRAGRPRGSFEGKSVTLVGLGTFGGGAGAARFLAEAGADVLVTDLRPATDLGPSLRALDDLPIRYRLGEHREQDVLDADLAVFSPAVPPHAPLIRAAREGGTPITSPLNLLWERLPDRPVGVTGTRGKTTTAHLLHAMTVSAGRESMLGGNVGGSLLGRLEEMGPRTVVVLEVSSFQLHWLRDLRESPRVAVITNFSAHHLDWHGSDEAYATAKRGILEFQEPGDAAILNGDDATLREWGQGVAGDLLWFSTRRRQEKGAYLEAGELRLRDGDREESLCRADEIPLRGTFQIENVMAAALAALAMGIGSGPIRRAVLGFQGLPHRLEQVATIEGVAYYNDSKATTPAAAAAAIASFDPPIFWIGGGTETGESTRPLVEASAGRVMKAFLLGEARERMARDLAEAIPDRAECDSLEEAVRLAREEAPEGCTILLSPGCASYDQFLNYEHRGDLFRSLVLDLHK